MEVSFPNIKRLVQECEEARNGQYINLELILNRLSEEKEQMDGEEAALRFLYELTKNQ